MGRYYVAGIPFDSENSLKHYGVKGMEWNKHKFGIDADTRYIKWLKDAGKSIGNFVTNTAKNVGTAATKAANTVGSAVNKGANFVGGAAQNAGKAVGNAANQAGKAIGNATNQATKWAGQQAQSAGKAIGTATGNVGNWANQQAQNIGNFVTGDQARKDLQDAQNSFFIGRQGRVNAAQDAYNQTLPGMIENASKNAGDWAQNASKDINNWVQNAGKAVGNAANQAGNWAGQAVQNVGGAVSEAAKDPGKAVSNAANKVSEGAKGFLNSAGQWVSGAANNAKNAVSKAASDVSKGASGFLNSAGQWVSNNTPSNVKAAAQNVHDFFSNDDEARRAADMVLANRDPINKTWATPESEQAYNDAVEAYNNSPQTRFRNVANSVGDWAGQAVQNVGNAVSGAAQNVGNFFSNRDEYQRLDDLFKHYNSKTGKWDSEENRKAFYEAQDAYNRHPITAIPDMARQIGSNISNSPVGDFARGVGEMANQVGSDVKNFVDYNVTGEGQRRMADMLMQNPDQVNKIFENDGSGWKQSSQFTNREAADRALAEANNTPFGRVSNAAQNVGNWAGQAVQNVGNWAGQTAQNVGQFIDDVRNAKTNAQIQAGLQRMGDDYAQRLQNLPPEDIRSPQHDAWLREQIRNDPQLRAYYEQNIREQTIPEQRITEQTIPEQRITEQTIPEQRTRELNPGQQKQVDYWDGVIQNRLDNFDDYYRNLVSMPRFQNYTREDVMNDLLDQQDYWRNRAYRENMRHSAIDDKPAGVSDAFWEKFTAEGGTREDYERDWR